jgi:hypothetical protein
LDTLIFHGVIAKGVGKYAELHVPGKNEIDQVPADWPLVLCKGSLNVRVNPSGYPAFFATRGLPNKVSSLDQNCFPSCFQIAHDRFGNNQLRPTTTDPRRGTAQVWRASLDANGHHIACWVLRRYGSALVDVLELLSDKHLRQKYGLADDQHAIVTLYAGA